MTVQTETVVLNPQVAAMCDELIKIGVHGADRAAVVEALVFDQLKYLCGRPGFRTLVDVAYDTSRAVESKRRAHAAAHAVEAKIAAPLPAGCTCTREQLDAYVRAETNGGSPDCPLHKAVAHG